MATNTTGGWVKMQRSFLRHPIISKDAEHLAIWTYLMLNAAHSPRQAYHSGKTITLAPGQLVTDRTRIASELKCSESKVQRVLKSFENEQIIEQQTSHRSRLITIGCDFFLPSAEPQSNTARTADEPSPTAKRSPNARIYRKEKERVKKEEKEMSVCSTPSSDLAVESELPLEGTQLVEWLEALYPALQSLPEPLTPHQGAALRRSFAAEDIKRIFRDMANNSSTAAKLSTYNCFLAYAERDYILASRSKKGKLLTYTEMVNSLKPGQRADELYARVPQRFGEDLYRPIKRH